MTANDFVNEINKYSTQEVAEKSKRFFKTDKGEYGEGDKFIGVNVPQTRKICKKFEDLGLSEVQKLLGSDVHEHRLAGVIILSEGFAKADHTQQRKIYDFYLKNVAENNVNNWDIVDSSAHKIVGKYLINKNRTILSELALSNNLWERRMSMMSTYFFIKNKEYCDTLKLADILLNDNHDLIHKVSGWMLREVGKKDEQELTKYLDKNASRMPRTMLRYAIEKLSDQKRRYYLNMK